MKLLLWMVFVNVYIHFRIWARIQNPRVMEPDPAKVTDPCGSGSTTLVKMLNYHTFLFLQHLHFNIDLHKKNVQILFRMKKKNYSWLYVAE
jgi:hypothetical protein